jgi:LuxR family maltose regulon positive regulatory protein
VAPAGAGKTTLLSHWLDTCPLPCAWLSLDENDSDLEAFLRLLVASVQLHFPAFGRSTLAWLSGAAAPAPGALAARLNADLIDLSEHLVVLLDDYHIIRDAATHQFVSALVTNLPGQVHLLIASRTVPTIPLARLRVQERLVEIHTGDLQFTAAEAQALLDQLTGGAIAPDMVDYLTEELEGWPVGLRLIAMSLQGGADVRLPPTLRAGPGAQLVFDFFIEEVYTQHSLPLRDALLKTSILDRLTPALCEAVVGNADPGWTGEAFLDWLQRSNVFVAPLNGERVWYRYHHLFQAALQHKLRQTLKPADIALLHHRAAAWFAGQGFVHQAIVHYLAAHETDLAVDLIERNCLVAIEQEQWLLLEHWLDLLPTDIVARNPSLLTLRGWVLFVRQGLTSLDPLFQEIESLLADPNALASSLSAAALNGLLLAVWGGPNYMAGNAALLLVRAQAARAALHGAHDVLEAWAICFEALALQLVGRLEDALHALHTTLAENLQRSDLYSARRMLFGLTFVEWHSGQLFAVERSATHFLELNAHKPWPIAAGWVHSRLAMLYYEWNQLDKARFYAEAVIAARHEVNHIAVRDSVLILALVDDLQGQPQAAEAVLDMLHQLAENTTNLFTIQLLASFRARRAVLRGDGEETLRWLHQAEPMPDAGPMVRVEIPQLTQARVLLAQRTAEATCQALEHLSHLHQLAASYSNTTRLVEILALTAIAHDQLGDQAEAIDCLQAAVALAEPGRFVRTFLDLGPELARLLSTLARQGNTTGYIADLLHQFAVSPSLQVAAGPTTIWRQQAQSQLIEPLTERELEVLDLLVQRLSYQEIALHLVISPATVKSHINHIYQKLQVNSRNGAIDVAKRLGLWVLN